MQTTRRAVMTLWKTVVVGLILALPAAAQAQGQAKKLIWTAGGGSTITLSDTRARFGNGVEVVAGAAMKASERLDVQFEYAISWHAVKGEFFELPSLEGNQRMQQFAFNAKYHLTPPEQYVGAYLVGGPAVYRRDVSVTYFTGVTDPVCDPYLLICAEDPEANLLGSRGSWDFGFSVGAGFTLPLADYLRMAIESRYVYVWGPELDAAAVPLEGGTGNKANGQFLPLRIIFVF